MGLGEKVRGKEVKNDCTRIWKVVEECTGQEL